VGWLANLGANGCRRSMRAAYQKHVEVAKRQTPTEDPHLAGLFGALASRYSTRGIAVPEPRVWVELAPFLAIRDRELAVRVLAEYVLAQESSGWQTCGW